MLAQQGHSDPTESASFLPARSKPPKRPHFPTRADIVRYLKSADSAPSRRDIARAFNIMGDDRARLRDLLREMEADGTLDKGGAKRFRAAGALPPVMPIDVITVDDDGDLVCTPTTWRGEAEPPMIRLPLKEAARTKPSPGVGDRLLARLTPAGDDSYSATVIKPIGKGAHRFLAVFRKTKYGGLAEPVERRARNKFTIAREDARGAEDGDLVWAEAAPRRGSISTHARVASIAGHVDDRGAFSLIALANHGIPIDLPAEVIAEAEQARPPDMTNREDLRDTPLLTIDPADAKDHDDAVFAVPDDDPDNEGGYRVIVAIADVSWFVRPGTALDREAQKRGNSVYLPDRVVPMLPERLSNDLCSLREGEDRPCLAVELVLTADGRKRSHRFMRAMMRSAAKLSYEDAQKLIDTPQSGVVGETVSHLKAAFDIRWIERAKREPLDLDLPERKLIFDDAGAIARVELRERFDAHRLIEEFMILANIAAAETLEQRGMTQIYRVHDAPDTEKLDGVREYLASLDYSLIKGGSVRPSHFNQLLKIAEAREQKRMISEIVLRSQSQAIYTTENIGHFGLNLARYSHFTSPIRRYADLTIHRALVSACKLGQGGQTPEEAGRLDKIAEEISDLERRAMAAERDAKDRVLTAYHEDHLGDDFTGRVRGVTRFGLFVALDETGADGFIPMRTLDFERFDYVEERHAVIGQTSGTGYRLGQPVSVRLAEATPLTGGLRFDMLSDPIDVGEPAGRTRAGKKSSTGRRGAATRNGTKKKTGKKSATAQSATPKPARPKKPKKKPNEKMRRT